MSEFLLEYPFAARLFPGRLGGGGALAQSRGSPWCCRTATSFFNREKFSAPAFGSAVEGRVMIYLHKENVLDHVQQRYPAAHYVMVDDKPNLLAAMKSTLGSKLTTVFVRQGHYALAPESAAATPAPDLVDRANRGS